MPTYYTTSNGTYVATMPTSSITSTNTVFAVWSKTAATTTSNTVWTTWITSSYDEGTASDGWIEQPQRSAEEQAALEGRMAARREQERLHQLAQRRAQRRALATLLRFISAAQRAELRAHGHFQVTGGATGNSYRIRRGRVANIDVLDATGVVLRRLCAHPAEDVPDSDTMLAQALHLQSAANEELFVRTANVHPLR